MTEDAPHWTPTDIEFAEARAALDGHPHRAQALTGARMALAAEGQPYPQFRDVLVRAAATLAEQANY